MEGIRPTIKELVKRTRDGEIYWQRVSASNGYFVQVNGLEFNVEFPQDGKANLSVYDLTQPGPVPGILVDGQEVMGDKKCLGGFDTYDVPEVQALYDAAFGQVRKQKRESDKKFVEEREKRAKITVTQKLEQGSDISREFFQRMKRG